MFVCNTKQVLGRRAKQRSGEGANQMPGHIHFLLMCPTVCQTKVLEDLKEFETIYKINKCIWHISYVQRVSLDFYRSKFPLFFPSLVSGGPGPEFDPLLKDYMQGGRNKRIILSQILWGSKSKSKQLPGKQTSTLSNPRMLPFQE